MVQTHAMTGTASATTASASTSGASASGLAGLGSGPISIVKVHSINITNLGTGTGTGTGTGGSPSLSPSSSSSSTATSNSGTIWYEQWIIIRFDLSASLACAEYYQLYIEELQLLIKQQKNKQLNALNASNSATSGPSLCYPLTGDLPDLSSPLAFQVLCRQVKFLVFAIGSFVMH
jgi:hypothetical protein